MLIIITANVIIHSESFCTLLESLNFNFSPLVWCAEIVCETNLSFLLRMKTTHNNGSNAMISQKKTKI